MASQETEGHLPAKWKHLKHGETGTASGEAEEKEPKSDWLCTMSISGPVSPSCTNREEWFLTNCTVSF